MAKPKSVTKQPKITSNESIIDVETKLNDHINDKSAHTNSDMIDAMTYSVEALNTHLKDQTIHISNQEREMWNAKETPNGAQSKVNKVLVSLNNHKDDYSSHITKAEKDLFKDKYTKAETRNLLKHALTGLKFLQSVSNRSELERKYPNPEFNSCVYLRYEKITLIYNGQAWVEFNALFTQDVTKEFDGFMTQDDKVKLDSIEEGANNYVHPDNVDVRHVNDAQIFTWNNKAEKSLVTSSTDGLMSSMDKVKLDSIEKGANNYTHPEYHGPSIIKEDTDHRFVTDKQISNWDVKTDVEFVTNEDMKVLATAKAFTDTKISAMLNSTEEQLQVLRSLAFELKNDNTVKQFFDLYNECAKNEELATHINDKIHMTNEDRILLNNVSNVIETGLFPEWKDIQNKPEAFYANGGNSDTVGGYTADQLLDNKYFYDKIIRSVLELKDIKGNVLIKAGTYKVEDGELVINTSGSTLSGVGILTELVGLSIKVIGNNNTIENLKFVGTTDKICICVSGDNNVIRFNSISNYDKAIIVDGSNNIIENNTIESVRTGIELISENNSNYGNRVEENNIKNSNIGICLMSSNNTLTKNHLCKNNVDNCNIGIVLSNTLNNITKTTMNIINENIVVRGRGNSADYTSAHKTIVSEFSSKNIISSNITSGKSITAPNDILSNNIC